MKRTFAVILWFLTTHAVVGSGFAAPVTYFINFTLDTSSGIQPVLPDSGVFTYDAAAPLTSRFSGFQVVWNSSTFDLTALANTGETFQGTACGTTPSSASVFSFLTGVGVCTGSNVIGWAGSNVPQIVPNRGAAFVFFDRTLNGNDVAQIATPLQPPAGFLSLSTGTFTSTAIPEPSYSILLLASGAFLIVKRNSAG